MLLAADALAVGELCRRCFASIFGARLLTPRRHAAADDMRCGRRSAGACSGCSGRMAARDVVAALSRTSVAIAALMIAMSVTVGVGIMVGCFRNTVVRLARLHACGPIFMFRRPAWLPTAPTPRSTRGRRADSAATPGVAARSTVDATSQARSGEQIAIVVGVEIDESGREAYMLVSGPQEAIWRALRRTAACWFPSRWHIASLIPASGGRLSSKPAPEHKAFRSPASITTIAPTRAL